MTSKRRFRPQKAATDTPRYPSLLHGRRQFLQRLGKALAGGALLAAFPRCGIDEDPAQEVSNDANGVVDSSPALLDMGASDVGNDINGLSIAPPSLRDMTIREASPDMTTDFDYILDGLPAPDAAPRDMTHDDGEPDLGKWRGSR